MMLWRFPPVLGLLLLTMGTSLADDNTKVSVFINHAGSDAIGQHGAAALERLIEASPDYKLAPSHAAMMRVSIASLALARDQSASRRATVSTVITMRNYLSYDPSEPQTWYPIFLTANLVVIDADGAEDYAGDIFDRIGAELERYREDVRKYQLAPSQPYQATGT